VIPAEQILDAHCETEGSIVPRDPQAMRQWLLKLVERARDAEQHAKRSRYERGQAFRESLYGGRP
jgi:hypothetical protein